MIIESSYETKVLKYEEEQNAIQDPFASKKSLPIALQYLMMSYLDVKSFWNLPRVNNAFRKLTSNEQLSRSDTQFLGKLKCPAILRSPQELMFRSEVFRNYEEIHLSLSLYYHHASVINQYLRSSFTKISNQNFFVQECTDPFGESETRTTAFRASIITRKGGSGVESYARHLNDRRVLAVAGNHAFVSVERESKENFEIHDLTGETSPLCFTPDNAVDEEFRDLRVLRKVSACFPLDSDQFVTLTKGGLLQRWEMTQHKVVCLNFLRLIPQNEGGAGGFATRRIGNTLYFLNINLKAYSLVDLTPIVLPKIVCMGLEVNGHQVYVKDSISPSRCALSVYNTKSDGTLEEKPAWTIEKIPSWTETGVRAMAISEKWISVNEKVIDTATGKSVYSVAQASSNHVMKASSKVFLKGEFLFEASESSVSRLWNLSCIHLLSQKQIHSFDLPGFSEITDLEMRVEGCDSALFILANKIVERAKVTHILRFAL